MRQININNPILNSYITDLASDYASGTAITVKNNNSFAANDLLVFGKPTEERTEQKKITAVNADKISITLDTALSFSHQKGTPVYKSLWDFVSIEGRSSSAGVFAEITQSPIQWDAQENKTIYFHSDGTDTWQYRFRFLNSVTSLYSEYSPTLTGAGFTRKQLGYIIKRARKIAGDTEGRIMSTDELLRAAVRAKHIIRAHNPEYWFWKVDGYKSNKSIAATSDDSVYDLASITDLGVIDSIEYKYTSGAENVKYELKKKGDVEFKALTRDLNRPSDDHPRFYRLLPADDSSEIGYFEIDNPIKTDSVGTFYINYYKDEANYDSVDDETSIVIPEILEDFLASEIYAAAGNETMAERYRKKFSGPEARQKTLALEKLDGIALLDALDKQYKEAHGQPKQFIRFRGQKAMSRLYGSRYGMSPDYRRENYFDD